MFIVATPERLAIDTGAVLPVQFFTDEASAARQIGVTYHGRTPRDRINSLSFVLSWRQVNEIEAADPWPALRVAWRHNRIEDERVLSPGRSWFGARASAEELAWEQVICALFDFIDEAKIKVSVDRGWTSYEHTEWIEESEWPLDIVEETGSYRTAPRTSEVLARRAPPKPWEAMLTWLAAGPGRPPNATPREVVVTAENLFAKFSDRSIRRLPLTSLRARRGAERGDAVYIFGRRTPLVLPIRRAKAAEQCPVRVHLDGLLADR